MKYKVKSDSPSWPKVQAVFQKIKECAEAATKLVEEITPGQYHVVKDSNPFEISSTICGFIMSECPKGWREVKDYDGAFFPKKIKANKDLLDRIDKLPKVTSRELGEAIGYGEYSKDYSERGGGRKMSFQPHGWVLMDDAFYFTVPEFAEKQYKPLEGIVEVLTSEYDAAVKEKSKAKSHE